MTQNWASQVVRSLTAIQNENFGHSLVYKIIHENLL